MHIIDDLILQQCKRRADVDVPRSPLQHPVSLVALRQALPSLAQQSDAQDVLAAHQVRPLQDFRDGAEAGRGRVQHHVLAGRGAPVIAAQEPRRGYTRRDEGLQSTRSRGLHDVQRRRRWRRGHHLGWGRSFTVLCMHSYAARIRHLVSAAAAAALSLGRELNSAPRRLSVASVWAWMSSLIVVNPSSTSSTLALSPLKGMIAASTVLGVAVVSGVRLQDEDAVVFGRGVCRRRWVVPRCWRRAPDLQNLDLLAELSL